MSMFVRLSITRVTHVGDSWGSSGFLRVLGLPKWSRWRRLRIVGRDRNDRLSNDLTVRTGAPTAIFSPAAYPFVRQKTQHVIYQGFGDGSGDGQVHELWWDGHWQHNNLTSQTDAPLIAGEPWGYVYEDQPGGSTQHVVYQGLVPGSGPDGRVQELWWDDDKNHHQLTSGVPPLVDRPFGYSFEVGQHIVYRAANTLRFLDMEEDFGWLESDLTPYMAGTTPLTCRPPPTGSPRRRPTTSSMPARIGMFMSCGKARPAGSITTT